MGDYESSGWPDDYEPEDGHPDGSCILCGWSYWTPKRRRALVITVFALWLGVLTFLVTR